MTSIAIQQAYARLGDFRLEDISVSVESGEFFVILGPSGAGKTVLLDLIAGFIYPRQGGLLLDGADISFYRQSGGISATCSKTTPCSQT